MIPFLLQPKVPHWDFPEDQAFAELHAALREKLDQIFQKLLKELPILNDFDSFVKDFLNQMELNPWGLFRFFLSGKWLKPDVTTSSLHTAMVCHIFSTSWKWSKDQRELLVRGALLHDVGMLFLPQALLTAEGQLTPSQRSIIESHPSLSYERVKKWGEAFEATQIALQHHEEWSGGGYPQGLKDVAIHPWALLVAVADNFVARTTQRSYRDSLVGYSAVKQLIQEQSRFSGKFVKDFVAVFGVNPPGGIVFLSDGSIGHVLEANHGQPLRPKVRIMIDKHGNEFRSDLGMIINLASNPHIFVARPVSFADIQNAQID